MSMLTNNRKQRWLLPTVLAVIMLIVIIGSLRVGEPAPTPAEAGNRRAPGPARMAGWAP